MEKGKRRCSVRANWFAGCLLMVLLWYCSAEFTRFHLDKIMRAPNWGEYEGKDSQKSREWPNRGHDTRGRPIPRSWGAEQEGGQREIV